MSGPAEIHYELRVVRYRHGQNAGDAPDLYIQVDLQNGSQRTPTIKKNRSPEWNHKFAFSSLDTSDAIGIHVKRTSRGWRHDRFVGSLSISISSLLEECACGEVKCTLNSSSRRETPSTAGVITVFLKDVDEEARVGVDLENVRRGIERLTVSAETEGHPVSRIADAVRKLDEVVKAVDGAAKVNSYLNLTWQSLTVIYRIVSHQFKKDQKVIGLVQLMKETFAFAAAAESLARKTNEIKEGYEEVLKLTLECCQFVQKYAEGRFVERVVRLGAERKINEYIQCFQDLKRKMDSGLALHIASRIDDINRQQKLDELERKIKPAGVNTSELPRCLEGTRTRYLRKIETWRASESNENILWFNGIAGSGKSTIAVTIKDYCDNNGCLASFIFFRRGMEGHKSVICTVAYQLARFHDRLAENIISAANRFQDITGATPKKQFEELLLTPLTLSSQFVTGPIIILDALDECGSELQRREILQLLSFDFSKLPMKFRFFLTSRPENDIVNRLASQEHISELRLDNTTSDARHDVNKYLETEVRDIFRNDPGSWSWRDVVALGDAADGLFIWASTAIKVVRETDDPPRKLKRLLENVRSVGLYGIDGLYETVLKESGIDWNDDVSKTRFKLVLGIVLFAKDKFSAKDVENFLGLEQDTIVRTLGRLRSVLFYDSGAPVRLHHESLFDYLISHGRSGNQPWHIDEVSQKHAIAEQCFDIMGRGLHFNMCEFESSFVRNKDVRDLDERITKNVPRNLAYACRSWAGHLCDLATSTDKPVLLDKLRSFAYERLFYWFEVLSLTNQFHIARDALKNAGDWVRTTDADMASFLEDASKLAYIFANTFSHAISESAPHLYLSALSLSKFDNRVAEHYSKVHPTVSVSVREAEGGGSGPRRETSDHQLSLVWSVSFSPDGKWVVSASRNTISIWRVDSGELNAALTGHERWVTSVVFLPDGKRVVSGSLDGTVRIWDIDTGNHIVFGNKLGQIWSVAVSADGERVAVASARWRVHILNVRTGELIGAYDPDSYLSPIAISPNGTHIASAHKDRMVRIWNVDSGAFVANLFTGQTGLVTSLAFSPDGSRVVSGSDDKTLRIWDACNGNLVAGPFFHEGWVNSVVFSLDGNYVASGSDDRSIRIWDARTGQLIAGPFYGHTHDITSVTWSSDGTRIASGSRDRTVRIWDTNKIFANQDAVDKCTEDTHPRVSTSNIEVTLGQSSSSKFNTVVNWTLSEDGWVLGERGELLLWLPDDIRKSLWLPQTIAVMCNAYETRLDFTNYYNVLGSAWQNLPEHRAVHNEGSTGSSRPPTDSANSAQHENVAMVSITARSMPIKLLGKRRRRK